MGLFAAQHSLSNRTSTSNSRAMETSLDRQRRRRPSPERKSSFAGGDVPVEKLPVNHLLAAHNAAERERLDARMQPVFFKSGDVIYHPNVGSDFVYFPETAVFSQLNVLEDGKTVETAMVGKEGIISSSAIFGSQPSNFWTQVSVTGTAYKISADLFNKEFVAGSLIQHLFFEYLGSYITQISQRSVCNNHHCIEERFSTWLLMLDDRCQNRDLTLTHEQIAQFLGVHRPTVTNIAQDLRDQGTIDYLRGRIFILDRQRLEQSACECYSIINRREC